MKVVLLSPGFDGTDVGEAYVAFKWAEALSTRVELTVLALQRAGRPALAAQLPGAEVVTWPEPRLPRRAERINAMLKPAWPLLHRHVNRWLRDRIAEGRSFDVLHQLMPQAARYPTPLRGHGIPYVIGPLGGGLPTPPGFVAETGSAQWFTRLRALDQMRLRRDPWLRRSYAEADLVLGVAPYMKDILSPVPLRRFEPVLELGIDGLAPPRAPATGTGLRLLHVGRGVRTKGLRDVVRAMAHLRDRPDITLTSAGAGEEIALARAEAGRLGVADRITFLGRVPRDEVDRLYDEADVFVFPSFREPAGGVLYEALRAGLPVISVAYGGPDFILNDDCGIRIPLSTPEALSRDIAQSVATLADDPERRSRMSLAAHAKVEADGLWPRKAERMMGLYSELLPLRPFSTA